MIWGNKGENMDVKVPIKLHNRFDIEVRDAMTGALKQQAQAENMILNSLWALVLSTASSGYAKYLHVGTGTGTLATTRTSLFGFLFAKSVTGATYSTNAAAGWSSVRRQIVISETEFVGSVLSEIGIASGSASTTLVTHAKLQDMNGNPVSITKTDTDIITIYTTVYVYYGANGWDDGHLKFNFSYYNASFGMLGKLLGVDSDGSLPVMVFQQARAMSLKITSASNYVFTGVSKTASLSYDLANKRITQYARLAAAEGNSAGIRSVAIGNNAHFDINGSSAITGNALIGEQIGTGDGVKTAFKTAFPWVKPGTKIYVDGVEQTSGVTVDVNKPASNDLALECLLLFATNLTMGIGIKNTYMQDGSPYIIIENPHYQVYGIDAMTVGYCDVYSSDDMSTWTLVKRMSSGSAETVPAAHRGKRYFKIISMNNVSWGVLHTFTSNDLPAVVNNVNFASPPATGAVITADYTTAIVPKDVNHVFDLTIVWQLGEYIP